MNGVRRKLLVASIALTLTFVVPMTAPAQDEGDRGGRVRGKITSIEGASISIVRRDQTALTLQTTAETVFTIDREPATLADFGVDDPITARVHSDGSGGLIADAVFARSERPPHHGGRVHGQVASVDAAEGSISITGREGNVLVIYTTPETHILRNRQPATVADFVAGDRVKAHGERDPNGNFIADRVLGGSGRPD